MASENTGPERVLFGRGYNVWIMGIDGTWRRNCVLKAISAGDAELELEGSIEGLNLKEFFLQMKGTPEYDKVGRMAVEWRGRTLRYFPKPTIAMINGFVFGGGFSVVEGCDLAIAADEACADHAGVLTLRDRRFKATDRIGIFGAHRNERLARTNGGCGDREPLDDRLGILFEQQSIGEGRRV